MRAILYLAAILFIITGAAMAAAPFLWPMSVALGISIGQGLGIMLGGFVLLALAAVLGALGNIATALPPAGVPTQSQPQPQPLPQQQPRSSEQKQLPEQPSGPVNGMAENELSRNNPRVVEERMIAGHRAWILSDGSIEAELEQGRLIFEGEEHLRDYLRSLDKLRRQGLV